MASTGLKTRNNKQASSGGLSRQASPSTSSTLITSLLGNDQAVNSVLIDTANTSTMMLPSAPVMALRPSQAYSANALSVGNYSLSEGGQEFLRDVGINTLRPEVISLIDFLPIFEADSREYSAAGKLLDIQLQARSLRQENVCAILTRLRADEQARAALLALETSYLNQLNTTDEKINFLFSSAVELDVARLSFDIKQIIPATSEFLSLKDFFVLRLGFSERAFNSFSNTKILYQLIYELNSAMESHSSPLIPGLRQSYQADTSPINILTRTREKSTLFDIAPLRSLTTPKNAAALPQFRMLSSSLPSNTDERLKLLFSFVSKELRVSKGLGDSQAFLSNAFGAPAVGNPFDDILGVVGASILEPSRGPKSLASMILVSAQNTKILPFETKFINAEGATYIPGPTYFVDQIVSSKEALNTGPITKYTSDFNTKFADVKTAFTRLLNSAPGVLGTKDIYASFGAGMLEATSGLADATGPIDVRQSLTISLFDAASKDQPLKQLLFQFLLLAFGLDEDNDVYKPIFTQLITTDFKTIADISALSQQAVFPATDLFTDVLSSNSSGRVSEMLRFVATAIETRLFELYGVSTAPAPSNNLIEQLVTGQLSNNASGVSNALSEISPFQRRTMVGRSNVSEMLMNSVRFSFLTPNIINFYNHFTASLLTSATANHTVNDSSGRTRLNFLSTSTMCLMIFEIFVAFTSKYAASRFENTTASNTLQFVSDFTTQNVLSNLYQSTVGTSSQTPPVASAGRLLTNNADRVAAVSETVGAALTDLERSFRSVASSIAAEDEFANNILYIFETINNRLAITREHLVNFFVANRQQLGTSYLGESQIKVSKASYEKLKKSMVRNRANTASSPFLDEALVVEESMKRALQMLLSEKLYKPNSPKKVKLFSIGIPNGFAKGIQQHLRFDKINLRSFSTTEDLDLFQINVFKRHADMPEIVYKPQKFLVDLSLFMTGTPESVSTSLNELIKKQAIFTDYNTLTSVVTDTGDSILNSPRYSSLSGNDKLNLLTNHFTSEFLNLYIQLLTGLNLSESTFLAQEIAESIDNPTKQGIQQLLQTYIQNFPVSENFTTQSLRASSSAIDQLVSQLDLTSITRNTLSVRPSVVQVGSVTLPAEILEFLQTFSGSGVFAGPKIVQERFLTPKLFDRVFTLPVDTEAFELDMDRIQSQQSGLDLIERKSFRNKLKEENGKFILAPKEQNQIIFDDYFVTVEPFARRSL